MESIMTKPKYTSRKINNLKDLLEHSVALYSGENAFIKKTKEGHVGVTYKKYKEDVWGLGTELLKLNIKAEKVIIISEPRYEVGVSFMAIACGGGIALPLPLTLTENEIITKVNEVKAKYIVFSEKYRNLVKGIITKCETLEKGIDLDTVLEDEYNFSFLKLVEAGNKNIQNGDNSYAKLVIDSESIAGLFISSKMEKIVMLSHKNFSASLMGIVSIFPIDESEKSINLTPFSNPYEVIYNFLMILYMGGTVCFYEEDKKVIDLLKEFHPTLITFSPQEFDEFYNELWESVGNMPNIRKIKLFMIISEILRKFNIDIRRKLFKDIFEKIGENLNKIIVCNGNSRAEKLKEINMLGIKSFYGYLVCEATGIVTLNKVDNLKEKSIGIPLPEVKMTVNNTNGGIGEIILKGNFVMSGYYNDKKETFRVIKDGWLHTGDMGYRDNQGSFILTGRKKNKRH